MPIYAVELKRESRNFFPFRTDFVRATLAAGLLEARRLLGLPHLVLRIPRREKK
jgi:hypothetical protein